MKQFIYCVVFCAATAHSVVAQVSNMVRLVPNQSLVAVHARFGAKELFRIATNTPAFEDYGKHFMLAQVNDMRDKWHLEIPKKLAVEDLLFHIKPTAFGIAGVVETRDIRFRWIFERNAINHFWDLKYAPSSFRYHDDESAMLAKLPSIITAKEAEALARNALHKLGLTEELIGIKNTPERHQYKFEESNGTIYELPVFNITWRYNGPTRYAAENLEMSPVEMVISGIITNVVEYSNIEVASPKSVIHRPPMPTNYFQMLGLPTNYLDTLPERKRAVWGMPPLTNRWSEQQSTFNGESKSSTLVNMLFGSATNIAIIQNATTVLAYRILPMADPKKPAKKSIIGYPIVSGPVKVSSTTAETLKNIWLSESSYTSAMYKCEFNPGMVLSFIRDKEQLDLVVCLSCGEVRVLKNNALVGNIFFHPARNKVLELAKQIFPKDKLLQKMKAE